MKFSDIDNLSTGARLTAHETEIMKLAEITNSIGTITIATLAGTFSNQKDVDKLTAGDIILTNAGQTLIIDTLDYTAKTCTFEIADDETAEKFEFQTYKKKINLADEEIQREILIVLNRKFDQDNYAENLIDMVNNAESFYLSCDYMSLLYIYEDLLTSSSATDIYERKAQIYRLKYDRALNQALELIYLDTNFDDSTDFETANLTTSARQTRS